jgi:predicted nucleic acid-binding protein
MKAFLDTSVLVATFYGEHEHHGSSFALFLRLNKKSGCTAAHRLTEGAASMMQSSADVL